MNPDLLSFRPGYKLDFNFLLSKFTPFNYYSNCRLTSCADGKKEQTCMWIWYQFVEISQFQVILFLSIMSVLLPTKECQCFLKLGYKTGFKLLCQFETYEYGYTVAKQGHASLDLYLALLAIKTITGSNISKLSLCDINCPLWVSGKLSSPGTSSVADRPCSLSLSTISVG